MNKKELQHRAGILNENYHITSRNLVASLMSPDDLVWEMDGIPPAPSETERTQSRSGHVDVEIADIKHRAGIVEFVPGPDFSGDDDGVDPEGVPLWQRLQSIAKSAQGSGRIDQHQIEEIFRAAQVLKGYDR